MTMSHIEALLIGESAHIKRLRAQIARFAPTRLPVLIQGPTGSGKELVARALHVASGRKGAFVAFNVCALSDTMFEDALFGHVRGAFTGAITDRSGYLAEANGGTVLLDEIGGTALASQSKLLRAIETGMFRAVGAATDRVSDFRVIAASNEPLDSLVVDGRFRRDLLHRLAGVVLEVPPLRTRPDDVLPLAEHFMRSMHVTHTRVFTARAARTLKAYEWPGNVRELKHAVERVVILAGEGAVTREHIEQSLNGHMDSHHDGSTASESAARRELLRTLIESGWDTALAAQRLGIHRATVYRRMRQLEIDFRGADGRTEPESTTQLA